MLTNRSMPAPVVIPELPYPDVREAAGWLCRAFDFAPKLWVGDHRVQLLFGDGAIVLFADEIQAPSRVLVRVDDLDAHLARAEATGAAIAGPPQAHPYGEYQYSCRDPFGHLWTFSQSVADVDPASWGGVGSARAAAPLTPALPNPARRDRLRIRPVRNRPLDSGSCRFSREAPNAPARISACLTPWP